MFKLVIGLTMVFGLLAVGCGVSEQRDEEVPTGVYGPAPVAQVRPVEPPLDYEPTIHTYYQCVERAQVDYPAMLNQFHETKVREDLVIEGFGEYRPATPEERCEPRYLKMDWAYWPLFLVNPVTPPRYPKYDRNDTDARG